MRGFAARFEQFPVFPDTRLSLLLTAATAQAFDWPSGSDLVRISVGSTITGLGQAFFEPASTGAAVPTTGAVVTTSASTGGLLVVCGTPMMYQRPRSSTGFSVIAGSSVSVCIEFWQRGGS